MTNSYFYVPALIYDKESAIDFRIHWLLFLKRSRKRMRKGVEGRVGIIRLKIRSPLFKIWRDNFNLDKIGPGCRGKRNQPFLVDGINE